jgi:hypothetical protein
LLHIAVQDHDPGFCHLPERTCGMIARRSDVDGLPRPSATPWSVPGEHALVGADNTQPRVCRRPATTVEKVLRSRQPGTYRCHEGGVEDKVHGNADGGSGGCDRVIGMDERGMRAFPRRDGHIQMPSRIGHLSEHR